MTTIESVKVALPLPASASASAVVTTCTSQSATIKRCPAYATAAAVQAAVTDMDGAVATLQGTTTEIAQLRAQLRTLETMRGAQIAAVHLKHDTLETALNAASNGDPHAAEAWVGKVKRRTQPLPVSPSTNPPESPVVRSVKRNPGMVEVSCAKEPSVVCYVFQQGTDLLHPETWPSPVTVRGHTHKVGNLPIGQVVGFRVAIVRRGSVQSQWSSVLSITVR